MDYKVLLGYFKLTFMYIIATVVVFLFQNVLTIFARQVKHLIGQWLQTLYQIQFAGVVTFYLHKGHNKANRHTCYKVN